jgi:transposase
MTIASNKRDSAGLESRRLEGVRLLKQGMSQSSVARQLQVSRQAVHQWAAQLSDGNGNEQQLKAKGFGRPARLSAAQVTELRSWLDRGPRAAGLPADGWTIQRVCLLIHRLFQVEYSGPGCWGLLQRLSISLESLPPVQAAQLPQEAPATADARPGNPARSFDYVVRTLSKRGFSPRDAIFQMGSQ